MSCKVLTSVNFPVNLIVSSLSCRCCFVAFLFIFVVLLKNSVIMPKSNASFRKKNEEFKAQIDVLTDEFTVHTNAGRPPLVSVQAEGS